MPVKEGWTGRVYEDFEVGDIYRHPVGRTVIDADNIWFTLLTQNNNPIHFDRAYAAKTEFGSKVVDCIRVRIVPFNDPIPGVEKSEPSPESPDSY